MTPSTTISTRSSTLVRFLVIQPGSLHITDTRFSLQVIWSPRSQAIT